MNKLLESLEPYTNEKKDEKILIFRNYAPRSQELREFVKKSSTTVAEVELGIEKDIRSALKDFEKQQNEPLTLVPKKVNWDLKRNLSEKLNQLQKVTESSISKLKKQIKTSKLSNN